MKGLTQLSRRRFLMGASAAALAGSACDSLIADDDTPDVPGIDERVRRLADEAPLAMQFHGSTAEECSQWQGRFAKQLRTLLGPHRPPEKWQTHVERVVELVDHRRHELVLTAEGCSALPVYLLTPKTDRRERRGGVLALHGHGPFGYETVAGCDETPQVAKAIETSNYDYGRALVRRGYVVAVPCLTPFGRRLGDRASYGREDPCGVTFARLQLFGKLLMAENLRDSLWAVELLARHEQVDPRRLACVGLSYGGRMTMLTAALEPRIRVAVISGALNVMQERVLGRFGCGAQIIPGLLNYGDVPEIGSLIAPRPCVWEAGLDDGLIKADWAERALERMRRAYRAFEAEQNLNVDRFQGGHRWNGIVAYPLLDKVLGSPS